MPRPEHTRKQRRRLTPAEDRVIATRYKAGESTPQLARAFTCSTMAITCALRRERTPLRSHSEAARKLSAKDERQILQRYRSGVEVKQIAAAFSVTSATIRNVRKRHGVKRRTGPTSGTYVACPPEFAAMATRQGRVLTHRLTLAKKLGRPLSRSETVHHINGDSTDGRAENLQLRNGHHGKGIVMRCLDCGSHRVEAAPL